MKELLYYKYYPTGFLVSAVLIFFSVRPTSGFSVFFKFCNVMAKSCEKNKILLNLKLPRARGVRMCVYIYICVWYRGLGNYKVRRTIDYERSLYSASIGRGPINIRCWVRQTFFKRGGGGHPPAIPLYGSMDGWMNG